MSEFVEGALIALVGAVVGGSATGLVAWLQAKTAAKQQLEVLHRQQVQHAAIEIALVLEELGRELAARAKCTSERPHLNCNNPMCYTEMEALRPRLERVFWVWANWIPYPLREELNSIVDVVGYNRKGFDDLMLELEQTFPESCPRCQHFLALGVGDLPSLAYKVMQLAAVRPAPLEWSGV